MNVLTNMKMPTYASMFLLVWNVLFYLPPNVHVELSSVKCPVVYMHCCRARNALCLLLRVHLVLMKFNPLN
jgi:hypothetical protein